MKIRVAVTLDVDPDEWANAYGVETREVRTDVHEWAFHLLTEAARENGVLSQRGRP